MECHPELVSGHETESDLVTPPPRENGNPGQDLVSKLENPALYYSTVKKDKQCLRKKVVRHVDDDDYNDDNDHSQICLKRENDSLPVADTETILYPFNSCPIFDVK